MSPPDANVSIQKRLQRPALSMIGLSLALAVPFVLLITIWSGTTTAATAPLVSGAA